MSDCSRRYMSPSAACAVVECDSMETRLYLANVAPVFISQLTNTSFDGTGGLTVGIDGYDADGDPLKITAVSDNASIKAFVPQDSRFAKLHFVSSTGAAIGDILVQLFDGRSPTATGRFATLATKHINADGTIAASGSPFYTNVLVHRVIPGFMIQTGDAKNGNGKGGSPLGAFADKFDPTLSFAGSGVLAMANSGANTNDCQFFITDGPATWLNQGYFIFGQMISGQSVLDSMINLPRDSNDRPLNPPKLQSVTILKSPQDGSVTLSLASGHTGSGHVTISLDDGHGHVTKKTITVTALGSAPVITDPGTIRVTPGVAKSFTVKVADDGGLPVDIAAAASISGVTATVNNTTHVVTVTAPASFAGMFTLSLKAWEHGFPNAATGTDVVTVYSQKSSDPQLEGWIKPAGGRHAIGTFRVGNRLYVADNGVGLSVYDLTDPSTPKLLGSYTHLPSIQAVRVVGNTAFVASAQTQIGLVSIDVANPADMSAEGFTATTGQAVSLEISGNVAYVAEYDGGLSAYDISDPTAMKRLGNIHIPVTGTAGDQTVGVAVKGHYVFVSDLSGEIVAVDVSNPAAMKVVNTFGTGSSPGGVAVSGSYLYIADRVAGLVSYDVTNPLSPKLAGKMAQPDHPWQVTVANGYAVLGTNYGFSIAKVSNPAGMVQLAVFKGASSGGAASISGSQLTLPFLSGDVGILNTMGVLSSRTFKDGAGNSVTVSVSGGGTAFPMTSGPAGGSIASMLIAGGTSNTVVTISSTPGKTTVGAILSSGSIKGIAAATANLSGNLTVKGTAASLAFYDVSGNRTITLGSKTTAIPATTLSFHKVTDLKITTSTPIKSLTAAQWTNTDATRDVISAPSIGSMSVTGDAAAKLAGTFGADLNLSGAGVAAGGYTLGTANIAGDLAGVRWSILGHGVNTLTVKGTAKSDNIRSAGSINGIALGATDGSDFFAGIATTVSRHASLAADFTDAMAQIKAITINGLSGVAQTASTVFYRNSDFSAAGIGTVSLWDVSFANGGTQFGLWAKAAGSVHGIASVAYKDPTGKTYTWPPATSSFPKGDFVLKPI